MFVVLRDGTGYLQCIMTDKLVSSYLPTHFSHDSGQISSNASCLLIQCQTYNTLVLSTESTICVYGTLMKLPEGKTVSMDLFPSSGSVPDGHFSLPAGSWWP